ncbi:MAG: dihydrofolate reductase family protein [Chitinophagaceae bacterium]
MRKLVVYIAMSIDGYIAKPNNDLSFLQIVEQTGEDYGYNQFMETVDTIIIGRNTYNWLMANSDDFPYNNRTVYVITHEEKEPINNIIFYNKSLGELITHLKNAPGNKAIYCDGGAQIIQQLLQLNAIDELTLSIIPVTLGNGIALFGGFLPQQNWQLMAVKSFPKGLVQVHYKKA